jgi:hypothetical protein
MTSKYRIRLGFSVRDPNNDSLVHHGDSVIELTDEQAASHKHKLEPYVEPVEGAEKSAEDAAPANTKKGASDVSG